MTGGVIMEFVDVIIPAFILGLAYLLLFVAALSKSPRENPE
jgi:hypothetical protein